MARLSKKAVRLLSSFHQAAVAMAFKGSADPQEYSEIESDFWRARKTLYGYIAQLEKRVKDVTL